jgi:hypothetical protein
MRALTCIGFFAIALTAGGCGGSSVNSNDSGDGGGAGSDESGSDAGSSSGGDGDAGDGSETGGASSAGAPDQGGAGGTPPARGGRPGKGGEGGALPTAGSPATGGAPVTPPDGCMPANEELYPGGCQIALTCQTGRILTNCYSQGDGTWFCECSGDARFQTFSVVPSEISACRGVMDHCVSGEGPTPGGPLECMPQSEQRGASSCLVREICSQELEGDTGASVATISEVQCRDDGTGLLLCACGGSNYTYYLEGQDGTTACDSLLEHCDEPVNPDFSDARVECRLDYQSGGGGYCEAQSRCLHYVEVLDGISVAQNEYMVVFCQNMDGRAICDCSSGAGSVGIELEQEVTSAASCTSVSELCTGVSDVEFSGEPTCTDSLQTAQASYCEAQLVCSISGQSNGAELTLFGNLSVTRGQLGEEWNCQCSSDADYAEVPGEGASAWDVCTNAKQTCLDAIEVKFGNGGPVSFPAHATPLPAP